MKLDSKTASFYYSRPSEWLGGRRAVVPCAHILGGGSSINFMMYTRASASDYDDFQAKGKPNAPVRGSCCQADRIQAGTQSHSFHS